jgi:hypothetical protein
MERPRILYTEKTLAFVMEALGYETNDDFITKEGNYIIKNGERVKLCDVIGFSKKIGVITSIFDLVD